jgi:hypothetical protein
MATDILYYSCLFLAGLVFLVCCLRGFHDERKQARLRFGILKALGATVQYSATGSTISEPPRLVLETISFRYGREFWCVMVEPEGAIENLIDLDGMVVRHGKLLVTADSRAPLPENEARAFAAANQCEIARAEVVRKCSGSLSL